MDSRLVLLPLLALPFASRLVKGSAQRVRVDGFVWSPSMTPAQALSMERKNLAGIDRWIPAITRTSRKSRK